MQAIRTLLTRIAIIISTIIIAVTLVQRGVMDDKKGKPIFGSEGLFSPKNETSSGKHNGG